MLNEDRERMVAPQVEARGITDPLVPVQDGHHGRHHLAMARGFPGRRHPRCTPEDIVQARDLMSPKVVTIAPSESCLDAVVRMQRVRSRHLPVVSREGLLVGVVTDRDLRHLLFSSRMFDRLGSTRVDVLLDGVHVAEVMSTDPVTTTPDASLAEAASTMRKERVGSLPVLEHGRVVGILTETDVLRHIVRVDATSPPECAEIIVSFP